MMRSMFSLGYAVNFPSAATETFPLTLTLSREGRGDMMGGARWI